MCEKHTLPRRDYPPPPSSGAQAPGGGGARWALLILRPGMHGNRRFSEMRGSLGIARNVLSARLQRLLDEGILERRAYSESPPRYEYFLTEKGLDLWPALIALLHWGERYSPTPGGPKRLIVHKECGGTVSERGICERCGQT